VTGADAGRDISAASADDLLHPESDDVTHDLVRERHGNCEANGPFGQLERGEPFAHGVDDARAERKDAEMMLRGEKSEQGLLVEEKRGHPIARTLRGLGHQVHREVSDMLECGSRRRIESVEVVVHS